ELERRVLAASDAADLGAIPLSAYWQRRGPGGELFGLVIGTGGRSGDEEFERAVRALRAILRDELVV
ncbi:hypothetical protein ACFPZL_11175, partial [Leucobacter soli]